MRGGDERREPQAAPELDDTQALDGGQRSRECMGRRPELCPVRQELVVLECLLVDQRLGRFGPEQLQLDSANADRLFPQNGQSSASSPTVRPGGSVESLASASSTPAVNASRDVVS